jgi:hypothetical protein
MLVACGPQQASPTPTLIVAGQSILAATHFPTSIPLPTSIPVPTRPQAVVYTATPTIEPPPTHTPSPTPTPTKTPLPGLGSPQFEGAICQTNGNRPNLLVNGGFEGGQHAQDVEEVQVPDAWAAFWREVGSKVLYDSTNPNGYQRPEMIVIARQSPYTDPPRILEGNQAFRIEGNERAFDAGIFQQVATSPGDVLCLTGSGQAWSSHYSDDPFSSSLNSGDDQRNANFQLGIDLTAGTDPLASTVVWGDVLHPYNAYQPLTAVEAAATGPAVTVFVRGFMLWRFRHNEMFVDGISLVKIAP